MQITRKAATEVTMKPGQANLAVQLKSNNNIESNSLRQLYMMLSSLFAAYSEQDESGTYVCEDTQST